MSRAALLPSRCCCALCWPAAPIAERKPVGFHGLENKKGIFHQGHQLGATLVSVLVPDCQGNSADVILGYDTFAGYVNGTGSFGATVGRVVNRIAKSRFVLDGKLIVSSVTTAITRFTVLGDSARSFGPSRSTCATVTTPYITFFYHSFDGEQELTCTRSAGPQDSGDLDVYVTYQLSRPLRPQQHPDERHGHEQGDAGEPRQPRVLEPRRPRQRRRPEHELQLLASRYTPLDDTKIPTARSCLVAGTMYDFRTPTPVGAHMTSSPAAAAATTSTSSWTAAGRDAEGGVRPGPGVRRALSVANQPGVQLYTSNCQQTRRAKPARCTSSTARCALRRRYPDAVNHPEFPSSIVRLGQVYKHNMLF
ncbi:hypothetical protein ZWY2020_040703 [Hordeum vulgare]|nr:hypothetical protein ZWY2020_040703 [Hordeum vulgare]